MSSLLAIGVSSYAVRAALYTPSGALIDSLRYDLGRISPEADWIEQDPVTVWETLRSTLIELGRANDLSAVVAVGLTCQPATCLLWDRATGEPIGPAILWNDRRTEPFVGALRNAGHGLLVQVTTGRPLTGQGSAPKLRWMLDRFPSAGALLVAGQLAGGSLDAWLLGQLTGGLMYATDGSSGQQTLLMNIATLGWDRELARLFSVPLDLLPQLGRGVRHWGVTDIAGLPALQAPVSAFAAESAASLVGHGTLEPGAARCSYGDDIAALVFCGTEPHGVGDGLALVIYDGEGQTAYGVGATVPGATQLLEWCCARLGAFGSVDELIARAAEVQHDDAIVVIPMFTDPTQPDPTVRAAVFGLAGGADRRSIARAALESLAFQTADALAVLRDAGGIEPVRLVVDGHLAQVDLLMQAQADLLGVPIERPSQADPALRGIAYLAAHGAGLPLSSDFLANSGGETHVFVPQTDAAARNRRMAIWRAGLERVRQA